MKHAVFSFFYPGERNCNLTLIICAKKRVNVFCFLKCSWMETNFVRCAACDALGRKMSNIYIQRAPILRSIVFLTVILLGWMNTGLIKHNCDSLNLATSYGHSSYIKTKACTIQLKKTDRQTELCKLQLTRINKTDYSFLINSLQPFTWAFVYLILTVSTISSLWLRPKLNLLAVVQNCSNS